MAEQRLKKGRGGAPSKHRDGQEMSPALIYALNHPIRRQLLRLLNQGDEPRSPRELTDSVETQLSNLAYHMRVLKDRRIVRLARTRRVRGATEAFFTSKVSDNKHVATILAATESADRRIRRRGRDF